MMPNSVKSIAMTARVMIQATAETNAESKAPKKPAPSARKKAMNARTQAMGCRIIAWVRPSAVLDDATLKDVPSISAMMEAGW